MSHKFIHTSDWHLGKKLFKESRLEEQEKFLSWLIFQIKKHQVETLCISGDIFDTPHPSSVAQTLYYQFLKEAVEETNIEIFIISGNHDGGKFLEAPLPFLKEKKIHIVGSLEEGKQYSYHRDGITYHLFPYFRSHELYNYARKHFPELITELDPSKHDPCLLLNSLLDTIFETKEGNKNVLLAHHLFGNGELSGSELGLSLSGLDSIPLSILKERFDYVALGHLHNHQYLSRENPVICYSGSPIPFRFSERSKKKINLVSDSNIEEIEVPHYRNLYEMKLNSENYKSELLELVKNLKASEFEAFLEVQLKTSRPLVGVADEIRDIIKDYPIKLLSLQTRLSNSNEIKENEFLKKDSTPAELFEAFYLEKYESENRVPSDLNALFNDLLEEARGEK